jgi:hypothetical protein
MHLDAIAADQPALPVRSSVRHVGVVNDSTQDAHSTRHSQSCALFVDTQSGPISVDVEDHVLNELTIDNEVYQ